MMSASITILSQTTTVILDHHLTTYTVRYWIVRSWLGIDYNVMADFLAHLVNIQHDWLTGISLVVIHLGGISLYINYFYPLTYLLTYDMFYVWPIYWSFTFYYLWPTMWPVTYFVTCDLLLDHGSSFDLWPTFHLWPTFLPEAHFVPETHLYWPWTHCFN